MSELAEIKQMLETQNKERAEDKKILHDIHFAIYGNEKAGVNGMADTLKKHVQYIQKDKQFKWIVAGTMMGGTGGLWAYIKAYLGL